jgi:diguanylate cyclase (GGDEF)-like protein
MQKEFSSFKVTMLLYLIVLILPLGIFMVYKSFGTIQQDTKIVYKTQWVDTQIVKFALQPTKITKNDIQTIDKNIIDINQWVLLNNNSKFYIGARTLRKDFMNLKICWQKCKTYYGTHQNKQLKNYILESESKINQFAITVLQMVSLKQNSIINMFYNSIIFVMVLMLVSIYMIRAYIKYQMKKHAIYDFDTKFYNKQYFDEHLKTSCARAVRNDYALSTLSFSIDNFDKYTADEKIKMLQRFGMAIKSIKRSSDTVCRYDDNHFVFVLPHTKAENINILERRINDTIKLYDFENITKPTVKFLAVEYDHKISSEEHIKSVEKSIQEGMMYFVNQ